MKKKAITICLSTLVLMQTAFTTVIETGQYEKKTQLKSESFEYDAVNTTTVLVAVHMTGLYPGPSHQIFIAGYQDDLNIEENSNTNTLDFSKFDIE